MKFKKKDMRKQYETLLLRVSKEAGVTVSENWASQASDYSLLQKLNDCLISLNCVPFTHDEMENILD